MAGFRPPIKNTMKLKIIIYWIITFFISVSIVEIGLRIIYFQTKSKNSFAIISAVHKAKDIFDDMKKPHSRVGTWQRDPQYGFSHKANSIGII